MASPLNTYRHLKSILTFSSFVVLISCLTPINFPADIGSQRIVISGQVSNLSDRNIVYVGKTADTQRLPIPIEGASIRLVDQSNNSIQYTESQYKAGEYTLDGFFGTPGSTYYLVVALPNGEVYQSDPEQMPLESGSVSTVYEIKNETFTDNEGVISEQSYLKIYANSKLPEKSGESYFKWIVEEVFAIVPTDFPDFAGSIPPNCYIYQNADPQRIVLFNGAEILARTLDKNLVASRPIDYSFIDRHYFTTYQSSITKEAFEYWKKVNILANQVGSIFDTPPARITGNVVNVNKKSEEVLGYFQATNQSYDRFFVLKYDLPFPILLTDCEFDNRDYDRYPSRCLDCIKVRNSSYERPPWF